MFSNGGFSKLNEVATEALKMNGGIKQWHAYATMLLLVGTIVSLIWSGGAAQAKTAFDMAQMRGEIDGLKVALNQDYVRKDVIQPQLQSIQEELNRLQQDADQQRAQLVNYLAEQKARQR